MFKKSQQVDASALFITDSQLTENATDSIRLTETLSFTSLILRTFGNIVMSFIMYLFFNQHWSSFLSYLLTGIQDFCMLLIMSFNKTKDKTSLERIPLFLDRSDDSAFTDSLINTPQQAI